MKVSRVGSQYHTHKNPAVTTPPLTAGYQSHSHPEIKITLRYRQAQCETKWGHKETAVTADTQTTKVYIASCCNITNLEGNPGGWLLLSKSPSRTWRCSGGSRRIGRHRWSTWFSFESLQGVLMSVDIFFKFRRFRTFFSALSLCSPTTVAKLRLKLTLLCCLPGSSRLKIAL